MNRQWLIDIREPVIGCSASCLFFCYDCLPRRFGGDLIRNAQTSYKALPIRSIALTEDLNYSCSDKIVNCILSTQSRR